MLIWWAPTANCSAVQDLTLQSDGACASAICLPSYSTFALSLPASLLCRALFSLTKLMIRVWSSGLHCHPFMPNSSSKFFKVKKWPPQRAPPSYDWLEANKIWIWWFLPSAFLVVCASAARHSADEASWRTARLASTSSSSLIIFHQTANQAAANRPNPTERRWRQFWWKMHSHLYTWNCF